MNISHVIKDSIHNDVDTALMTGVDKPLQPGQFLPGLAKSVCVSIFDRKVLVRDIAPAEASPGPSSPRQEKDRIDAQSSAQLVKFISDCIERRTALTVFVSKVVDQQLIQNKISEGLSAAFYGPHAISSGRDPPITNAEF